jgi:hypothetical protein
MEKERLSKEDLRKCIVAVEEMLQRAETKHDKELLTDRLVELKMRWEKRKNEKGEGCF